MHRLNLIENNMFRKSPFVDLYQTGYKDFLLCFGIKFLKEIFHFEEKASAGSRVICLLSGGRGCWGYILPSVTFFFFQLSTYVKNVQTRFILVTGNKQEIVEIAGH